MEANKPTQLPYQDDFEFWRNLMRILVIVLFNPILVFSLAKDLGDVKEFIYTIADWPLKYHFIFFAPMAVSVMNLQMVWLEKRSGVPMQRISKNFIYGSWMASLIFYSLPLVALFSNG